jgi:glycosyltransferase involved in cell wall biosynthesis
MRICIDIQPAVAQRAGVGRYTKYLVEHLGEFTADDSLSFFYFDFRGRGLSFQVPNAHPHPCRWIPGRFIQQSWKRLNWPPFDWFSGKADLFHFPNFIIPPVSSGRKVVTIHDMSFLRFPQFAEEKNLRYLTSVIHKTVARADAIITDSKFSADEIADCLHIAPDRIFPVHLGVAPECHQATPEAVSSLRQRLGLERPYLLTVGTLEPRKNIPFLIDVFEQLKGFDGDLVVAGMRGWKYEPILARMQNSPLAGRIRYLEYVNDLDLPALYTGASLFITTSFYEGFGLPPLEAMACGTPVISSTGGSLAEVVGSGGITLDEFDAARWADTLAGVLTDPSYHARCSQQGSAHVSRFDWRETARQTFNVYRKVCP